MKFHLMPHKEERFVTPKNNRGWKTAAPCLVLLLGMALAGCGKNKSAQPAETAPPAAKGDEDIVTLTKANLQNVELKIEPVARGNIEITFQAAGAVSANLNKTAKIVTTLEGRLMQMNFDLNDKVKVGDVLALVETPELLGKPLELKAPIDGAIIDRPAVVGELVDKGTPIYTISDPLHLWVIAQIKERDIALVEVGQEATFTVLARPNERFTGKVARIGNQVQPDSRTLEVRIETENPEGKLKPGMFADVAITTAVLRDALVIPERAVQSDQERQIVFVSLGKGKFEKRVVQLGKQQGETVQVLDGLKEGEKIVTQGSFIVKSEMLKGELQEKD